jgi:short-subunit dehydrogenase
MRFPYSTALVTGASSGIGRSLAIALAAKDVDLVIVARREDRLEELAREITSRYGVKVEVLAVDLTDEKQLRVAEERLADPSRCIDLLVNNAGAGASGDFARLPADGEQREVMLNLVAPMRLTRAVLPRMIAAGHGGVLMVSSMVSKLPMPGSAVYGATKAALTSLGESLHVEVEDHGVHVTVVEAGLTHTEFHDVAGIDPASMPKMAWLDPDTVAEVGLAAVARAKPIVIPGRMNRIQNPILKLLPRALLRRVTKRYHK